MVTAPVPELRVMPPAPMLRSAVAPLLPPARKTLEPEVLKVSERALRSPPAREIVLAAAFWLVMLKKRFAVVVLFGKPPGSVAPSAAVDQAEVVLQLAVPPSQ